MAPFWLGVIGNIAYVVYMYATHQDASHAQSAIVTLIMSILAALHVPASSPSVPPAAPK